MKLTTSLAFACLMLVAVPAIGQASQDWHDHYWSGRLRAEIRREVRESLREARRAVREARREGWRESMRARRDALRESRRALRDAMRSYRHERWHDWWRE